MIRLITCVRRKKEISHQEFRRFWESSEFSEIMNRLGEAIKPVRHFRNLSLQVGANIRIMESRGSDEPYDGIIEWWWESAAQLAPLLDTARAQEMIRELATFQAQFVDFGSSPSFFTEA